MAKNSQELFARAVEVIPGGVNSPVRAFKAVGGEPLFIKHARGSQIFDVDDKGYIDYVGSWGPMIAGHANHYVVDAIKKAVGKGTSYGAPNPLEVEMAELVREAMPAIEMLRLVSSGTEAVMSALRLARAATGRDGILKFDGCYHGHTDAMLVAAGSGVLTQGIPGSRGVPAATVAHTWSVPYNDLEAARQLLGERGGEIAAVIVEPIAGNMGVVAPAEGFLRGLREASRECGALLIFDEVITGFRVGYGGAQQLFGVVPDLTILGKIIGGGLPLAAYGGRADLMRQVAPSGDVYQAGTLSGNPIALTAGLATLKILRNENSYHELEEKAEALANGLAQAVQESGTEARINRCASMMTLFFTDSAVTNKATATVSDTTRYAAFFHAMLEEGIYLPPSQFEAWFVSLAHSSKDIEETLRAARAAFARQAVPRSSRLGA